MTKKKTHSIIAKPDIMVCWTCEGKGELPYRNEAGEVLHFIKEKQTCKTCNGTGKWVENHYIVIDEVNKIAIDSATGG